MIGTASPSDCAMHPDNMMKKALVIGAASNCVGPIVQGFARQGYDTIAARDAQFDAPA